MFNKLLLLIFLIYLLAGCEREPAENHADDQSIHLNEEEFFDEDTAEINEDVSDPITLTANKDTIMTAIPDTLKMHAEESPDSLFTVLIVIEKGSDVQQLSIKNPERLMDDIFKAEITGTKILELLEIDIVKSIEEDAEVWGH